MQSTFASTHRSSLHSSRSIATLLVRSLTHTRTALGSIPPSGLLMLSIVVIQLATALAKQLFTVLDPMGASLLRTGFAALFLLLIDRPKWDATPTRRDYLLLGLFGLAIACMNLSYYSAVARIPIGIASALEFTGPLAIAMLGSRQPLHLLWVSLAAIGMILLTPFTGATLDPIGVGFALLAGGCWAAYILLAGRVGRVFPGGTGLALAMTLATLLLVPIGVHQAGANLLRPTAIVLGLVVALLGVVVPYSLEFAALKHLPPRVFGILVSMEPAVAALVGLIFLGEQLQLQTLMGMGLIVTAAIGVTLAERK